MRPLFDRVLLIILGLCLCGTLFADVSISGQVETTFVEADPATYVIQLSVSASEDLSNGINLSSGSQLLGSTTPSFPSDTASPAFEYMTNATFATFDTFSGATSSDTTEWITDSNNLGALYGPIESGFVWKNSADEVLTTEYITNNFEDGATTTTLSLVDNDGQQYGFSHGTAPVTLSTTGVAGLLSTQAYPKGVPLYVDFENLSFVGYSGQGLFQWSPINGNQILVSFSPIGESVVSTVAAFSSVNGISAGTLINSSGINSFGTNDLSGVNLAREAYLKQTTGEVLSLGAVPSNNKNCSSGGREYDCSTYGIFSETTGLSEDGLSVVGVSGMVDRGALSIGDLANALYLQAFRWQEESGMVGIGSLPGGDLSSFANNTNDDGSVIVGFASSGNGREAYRWTQTEGMIGLGDLSGGDFYSVATNLNQDGTVVVGFSKASDSSQYEAFRWIDGGEMTSIREWLTRSGISVATDAQYEIATTVNNDGSIVAGTSQDGIWIAYEGRGSIKTYETVTTAILSTATIPQISSSIPSMALHGAHHQPLLAQKKLSSNNCAWVNGDFANYQQKNADSSLVEVGFCHDLKDGVRGGIGFGTIQVDQTLDYSGSNDIDGKYLLAELDYQITNSPMLLSGILLHGQWDADINRGYLNAGLEDQSRGTTDIKATVVRGRIDWRDLHTVGDISITPKVEYTLTKSDVDGYTETTGGFPARFDPQSHISRESRIGVIAEKDLGSKMTIRGITEAVHRFDKTGASFSGEVIDTFPFSVPGAENRQNWVRMGGEIDYQIDKNSFLSASLMRSSRGEDAEVSGAVSFKVGF